MPNSIADFTTYYLSRRVSRPPATRALRGSSRVAAYKKIVIVCLRRLIWRDV